MTQDLNVEIQRKRVNTTNQIGAKRAMHGTMPRNTVQPLEMGRPDFHIKMTFAALAIAPVAAMAFTIVNDA